MDPQSVPLAQTGLSPDLMKMTGLLVGIAFLPFLVGMISSFAKIIVVSGILRQGLGLQQVPPTSVLTGLALVLTISIMAPVAGEATRRYRALPAEGRGFTAAASAAIREPIDEFLHRGLPPENVRLFEEKAARLGGTRIELGLPDDVEGEIRAWTALLTRTAPAFLLKELSQAFLIGFIVLIPFLILDLVVGNILLSLGMMMMSPQVVSLPLKILLFVLIDGWRLILGGLLENYTVSP